ncbi:MAG: stalk domain-containing protein [Marinisporobacter sp.]|nr:stalk domain-containing protein [Marinisporobacter sp.]
MLKKRKMKVVTLVFILIISLILPTTMGYAVESETIEITQDTADLKQIQSSTLNVTVKKDGSYGAVLRNPENPNQPRSIFFNINKIGGTRSGTIQLRGDHQASFESLTSQGFSEDLSMEGKTIKVTKEKLGEARYTLRTSIVNATPNGSDMKLEMKMENLKSTPQNMGLHLFWDTMVNGQDSSPFIAIENGWVNFYNGILVTAFFKDTPHVTNADAISFGPGGGTKMTWEDHAKVIGKKTPEGDGYANAWYDPIEVAPGDSRTVSFIIGGANDQGAVISEDNMGSIASKNYSPGETISLTGKVEDPDAIGNIVDVMCSLGNNNPVKLGTLDTASGAKTYDYNYTLPSDLAPGLHPLKLWVRDHLFAESNVVSANINIPANQNPSISINNPSEDYYYNSGKITISGNASDADDDDMTIAASIDGNTVTDIVYGGDGNWTLEWDIDALDISDATYTDILVSADDGNSGTGTDIYTGDLILDTIKPSGNISTDISSYTKGKVKLTLTVSDDGSGVRKVKRPDNQWVVRLLSGESQSDVVSGAVYEAVYSPIDQVEYTVSQNGEYAFFVEDFAGNQNKIALNISNIDKSIPTADFTLSTDDWTNETVTIHVYGVDNGQSGIKRIKLPNNTWVSGHETSYNVSENGTYNFVVENNVGNQNTVSTSVTNIDQSTPTAKFTLSTENWTNEEVTIHVDGVDNGQSGIKRIKLPNNTWVSGDKASYNVSENGTYKFVVENNAGNQNTVSTSVKNIDKVAPSKPVIERTPDVNDYRGIYVIKITGGEDKSSGVKETQYRLSGATEKAWTKYESPIEITTIGKTTIEAKTMDQVGNESEIVTIGVNVMKKSSSSGGGSSSSLKDVDGDIEVDKTSKNPAPTINLSEDRDGNAPVSLKTVKEMKEANKTILVENNGVKIGFKPDSIQATVIKEELEKELDQKLAYENVKLILGAKEISSSEKEQIIRKANLGQATGLFQVGGKVFDLTAKVVKEKNGTKTEEKIKHFNEPVEVTIDLKGSNLTQKNIEKLTAVRYEKDEKGNVKPIKLGGRYDSKAKTFTFYTDTFSLYSIVRADDMLEIDLNIGKTEATVNKEIKENDVAPKIINNRTMVPVRFIAENMGADVAWDKETREVTIELDGLTMSMIIDEEIEEFDAAPMIIDGRTLVPIRYVSEKLGAYVIWFPTDKKVRIVK